MTIIKFLIGLFFLLQLYIIARKYTVPLFWFSVLVFFDPGGFVEGYGGGNLIGRLNISDVFFVILSALYFVRYKYYFGNRRWSKDIVLFILWLIIFLLYYIFAYGYFVPIFQGYPNFPRFLLKSRAMFYLPFIFIYVYDFARIDYQSRFINYNKVFTLIILPLFILSYITGIEIVPVIQAERFAGSGMQRVWMASYGFMYLSFYFALVILLLNKKYLRINAKERKNLLIAGGLMVLVLLITLTRREIIRLIAIPMIMSYIVSKIEHRSILNKTGKIIIGGVFILLIMSFVFTTNFTWLGTTVNETVLLLTTGEDSKGNKDERLSQDGGLIYAKEFIKKNFLFGNGYYPFSFGEQQRQMRGGANKFVVGLNSASEVGIYGAFFKFGFVGVLLSFPFYYIPFKKAYLLYKKLKMNPVIMENVNPYDIIFVIFIFTFFVQKLVLEFISLFGLFGNSMSFAYYLIILALFYNSYKNIMTDINLKADERL